jgi:hypothetical protein
MRIRMLFTMVVTLAGAGAVSADSALAREWFAEWGAQKPPAQQSWANVELSGEMVAFLKEAYPDHAPMTLADYHATTVERASEYLVWNVSADFDGNGMDDVALLMKDGESNTLLVTVHVFEHGFEQHLVRDEFGRLPEPWVLGLSEPGVTYVGTGESGQAEYKDLTSPGIVLVLMDTCSNSLYYFDEGEYSGVYRGH